MHFRNANTSVLTRSELRHLAPSIFADQAHESRSDKFKFVQTSNVIDALGEEGFLPIFAAQTRTRVAGKKAFTKHIVALRPADNLGGDAGLDELIPEIILTNAHDGSSSYCINAGLFRKVCMNGAVVDDTTVQSVRIRHNSRTLDDVIEGVFTVVRQMDEALSVTEDWRATPLVEEQRLAYAKAALALRWDEDKVPLQPAQLLRIRHREDINTDLHTTFQVVQENLMKGGQRNRSLGHARPTRAVSSVNESMKLNTALWTLTREMHKLAH